NVESSVKWLENGAQPTETAKSILSYKGVLMKHHLQGGVTKGALTQEQADAKFEAWLNDKENAVGTKKDSLAKAQADAKAKALEAEKEVNEKRKTAATQEEEPAVEAEATAEEAPVVEEAPATEEAPVAEEEVSAKE